MRIHRLPLAPVRAAARSGRDILTTEAGRALDATFSGPLPEEIGRSLIEYQVVERVVAGMVETAESDGYDADRLTELVQRIGKSPAVRELLADGEAAGLTSTLAREVVGSAAFKQSLKEVLSSPEIRAALASQSADFGVEIAAALRRRSRASDERLEAWAHRVFRLAPAERSRFGGFATRGVALVVDALLAELGFLVAGAAIVLVAALAGGLHSGWLGGSLAGAAWFAAAGAYFVAFWSVAGQTPGMRLMGVRVVTSAGAPLSVPRALVRFVGLILAIIPLFAGFLPALFDSRRRGLADFLSGTVVVEEP
jgi:uncharacterized RDD family membrane protein YckC